MEQAQLGNTTQITLSVMQFGLPAAPAKTEIPP